MKTLKLIFIIISFSYMPLSLHAQSWSLTGNTGTNPSTNFIGTTDNKAFKIRTNNNVRVTINGSGKVGIGNTSPVFKLDIKGGSINTDSLYRLKGKTVLITTDSLGSWSNFFAGPGSGNLNPAGAVSNRGNVAVGISSFPNNLSGVYNTCLGAYTGDNITSGDRNTIVGYIAGGSLNSDNNTLMGSGAGSSISSGGDNTAIGQEAGYFTSSGSSNVFIGKSAGESNNIGSNNIAIGKNASVGNDLVYATAIGSGASVTENFSLVLGSSNQRVGIGTSAPEKKLVVSDVDTVTLRVTSTNFKDVNLDFVRGSISGTDWRIKNSAGALYFGYGTDDFASPPTDEYSFTVSSFRSITDNSNSLGTSSSRWTTVYAANGTINTSDARDKKDIKDLNYGLTEIMKLRPVSYKWKNESELSPFNGTKLGLIAQELQQIIPEVVVDKEVSVDNDKPGDVKVVPANRLGVFYADLIPVLIKGMQELNEELKTKNVELKQEIEMLKAEIRNQKSFAANEGNLMLHQNIPNPAKEKTVIYFNVPAGSIQASINIFSIDGKKIQSIDIHETGENKIEINCSEFPSGMYSYSLVADGKILETLPMIITR